MYVAADLPELVVQPLMGISVMSRRENGYDEYVAGRATSDGVV